MKHEVKRKARRLIKLALANMTMDEPLTFTDEAPTMSCKLVYDTASMYKEDVATFLIELSTIAAKTDCCIVSVEGKTFLVKEIEDD